MRNYKTETHLHVSEVSGCSKISAAEMVKLYKEAGYSTIFITDHLSRGTLRTFGDMSFDERIDRFFLGYELAKAAGDEIGLTVLPGAELTLSCSNNDYLIYGFDKELFLREDLFDMSIEEFSEYARDSGAMIVEAHPLRDGKCFPTFSFVDAAEAYNPNPRHENYTERVLSLAKEAGLPVTGGSDAHRYEDIARSGILTDEMILTPEDYIRVIRSGEYDIIKDNTEI